MVRRRAGGFRKGSERRSEVLKEGVVGIGVQGFKGRWFCTGLYSHL
jgi:hypothetical protein